MVKSTIIQLTCDQVRSQTIGMMVTITKRSHCEGKSENPISLQIELYKYFIKTDKTEITVNSVNLNLRNFSISSLGKFHNSNLW